MKSQEELKSSDLIQTSSNNHQAADSNKVKKRSLNYGLDFNLNAFQERFQHSVKRAEAFNWNLNKVSGPRPHPDQFLQRVLRPKICEPKFKGMIYLTESSKLIKNLKLRIMHSHPPKENHLKYLREVLKRKTTLHSLAIFSSLNAKDPELIDLGKALKELAFLKKVHMDFESCEKSTLMGMSSLIYDIQKLHCLEDLSLGFTGLTNSTNLILLNLSETLRRLTGLRAFRLNLSKCSGLTDQGMRDLARVLKTLSTLQSVKLRIHDSNDLTSAALRSMSEALASLNSLQAVTLDFQVPNIFDNCGLATLSQALQKHTELQILILYVHSHCEVIQEADIIELSKSLRSFQSLQNLRLYFSECPNLTNIAFFSLCESLAHIVSLKTIEIAFGRADQITELGLFSLSSSLKKLKSLETFGLFLAKCEQFTLEGLESLAQGLESFDSLREVNLHLDGCSQQIKIPEFIENLQKRLPKTKVKYLG